MREPRPLNILLVPVGSHGDVHPFLGIGRALLRRGHRVTVFTNGLFEPLAHKIGLDFVPVGTADEYRQIISDPTLWDPKQGWKRVFEGTVNYVAPMQYDALKARIIPGETVVVGATLAFGARTLRDEMPHVPLATVHLQPSIFRSVYETPRLPGVPPMRWAPPWLKRAVLVRFADWAILDPAIGEPLNAFRTSKGLPPVKHVTSEWWHSPDRVIGLWPEWFAKPQPDWPAQTRLTGFPLFDESGIEPLPGELVQFLDAGDKPIAFTPGSAMSHGREFFAAAADACRILGRRGLLLSRHTDHLPAALPPGVIHVPYAPFSQLLPRCAALVHHGGIGTTAQALAAGLPQLIQPMSHDQPDNAERLRKLGVGYELPVRRFTGPNVASKLRALIESPEVARRCADVAARFPSVRPLEQTCDLIEELGGRASSPRRGAGVPPASSDS